MGRPSERWVPPPLIPQGYSLSGRGWRAYAEHQAEVIRWWSLEQLRLKGVHADYGQRRRWK